MWIEYEVYEGGEDDEEEEEEQEGHEEDEASEDSFVKCYFCAARSSYIAKKDGKVPVEMCHGCFANNKAHFISQGFECD